MNRRIIFPLFIFLFLILFSINVKAYQQFNANSIFNNGTYGFDVADQFNPSICFGWWCFNYSFNSESCFNSYTNNSEWILESNSNCSGNTFTFGTLTIKMLNISSFYKMNDGNFLKLISTSGTFCDKSSSCPYVNNIPQSIGCTGQDITPFQDLSSFTKPACNGANTMLLPAYREGIAEINYTINNTANLDYSHTILEAWQDGITQVGYSPLSNPSGSSGFNYVIIPPVNYDRNITVFASWFWQSGQTFNPVKIKINKFSFYTLDKEDLTDKNLNISLDYVKQNCQAILNSPIYSQYNTYVNDTSTNSYIAESFYAIQNDDNLKCGVYQLGQNVFIRRIKQSDITYNTFFISNDIAFFKTTHTGVSYNSIFTTIKNNKLIFTYMGVPNPNMYSADNYIIFSTSGNIYLNNTAYNPVLCKYPTHGGITCLNDYYNINTYGNQWYYKEDAANQTSSLFDTFSLTCGNSIVCFNNSKYYIYSNCQNVFLNNCTYGCNYEGTDCLYPSINNQIVTQLGRYCKDNYIYLVFNSTCGLDGCAETCNYPNQCFQINSTNIICGNMTTQTNQTIAYSQISSNPYVFVAYNVITLLNSNTDINVATFAFSFLLSFFISIIILAVMLSKHGEHAKDIFAIVFVGFLIFFTVLSIPYISYLLGLDVIIIIFVATVLSGALGKIIHGG